MSITPGMALYKLAFQLSPIILTGGVTRSFPGFALPIIAITEALNFPLGLLSGGVNVELDRFFANYRPMQGASIINQEIGKYPFANQTVAANAVITQPLNISLEMIVPVQNRFGYLAKLAIMTALQAVLKQHNATGGTYIIATPSHIYTNCVMTGMRDISTTTSAQVQNTWQLDFEKPLLTLEEAQGALTSLYQQLTDNTPLKNPAFSGVQPSATLASPSVAPVGGNLVPTNVQPAGVGGAGGG